MEKPNQQKVIYFDVGDVIYYLAHHSAVSGIQRVVIELWKQFKNSTEFDVVEIAHDPVHRTFVEINRETFKQLIQLLSSNLVDKSSLIKTSDDLRMSIPNQTPIIASPNSILFVAGSAWTSPGYFVSANNLKATGTKILTLVYDLIPIIDANFPIQSQLIFRRYMNQLILISDCIATISEYTRKDLEKFATKQSLVPAGGPVMPLPGGFINSLHDYEQTTSPYDKPYILMVGTIEERKNHLFALRAYQQVLKDIGEENTPDLICIGRLGWNVKEFIDEWLELGDNQYKVKLLTNSVTDHELAAFYKHALFTIYPSKYEGWGLPISESLDFGTPVISSNATSLTEAGGNYSNYISLDDPSSLAKAISSWVLNPDQLAIQRQQISQRIPLTWSDATASLMQSFTQLFGQHTQIFRPQMQTNREYPIFQVASPENASDATKYLNFIERERSLPMTNKIVNVEDAAQAEFVIDGPIVDSNSHGTIFESDKGSVDIRFAFKRDTELPLELWIATGANHPKLRVRTINSTGSKSEIISAGGVVRSTLGSDQVGATATVTISFESIVEKIDSPLRVQLISMLVKNVDSNLLENEFLNASLNSHLSQCHSSQFDIADVVALKDRQIESLKNSLSWKITSPIRMLAKFLRFRT